MTQRIKPPPGVPCPGLTIRDLAFFREIYAGLKAGKTRQVIAGELGVGPGTVRRLLQAVERSLNIPGIERGFIGKSAAARADDGGPAARFHDAIGPMIHELTLLVEDCRKAPQQERVIIQGTEFGILWLLPHVLEKSRYLDANPLVILDIQRTTMASRFLAHMEAGQADLAIGLLARKPETIRATPLLTVPRVIIHSRGHRFNCGKDPGRMTLADLRRETVFIIPGDPDTGLGVERHLPEPEREGRRVYLDSTSHMYQYVRKGLGVAIGYEERYIPAHMRTQVAAIPLPAERMPSAQFCLYTPFDRPLSRAVAALQEAIETQAPTLGL
jgi:DNA-binding transcriptional LysR family regulator